MAPKQTAYQEVFAVNLRRIRGKLTQDELARRIRIGWGLKSWTQATVAAVETGRRGLSLGEAFLLQQVLQSPLSEFGRLRPGQQSIDVEGATITAKEWEQMVQGRPPRIANARALNLLPGRSGVWTDRLWHAAERIVARYGLADGLVGIVLLEGERMVERRAASRLRVNPVELAAASHALWGHGLTEKRDSQVQPTGNEASDRMRAAHVTRALQKEIARRIRAVQKEGAKL